MSDIEESVRTSTTATKMAQEAQDDVDGIVENLPTYSNNLKKLRVTVNDLNSGTGISDTQCMENFNHLF